MRYNILLITVYLLTVTLSLQAQAPDWGEADTLACHKLGPGIEYTKIYFTGKKMLIWVTKIDLTNPYNKIEQVQSHHQVPDLTRWTVPEHYRQNSRPGHKVCVAFNHDFFSYEGGFCIGMNISEGEIPFGNGWGRSTLAINKDKKAAVFNSGLDAKITLPDRTTVKIDHYNRAADWISGDCILFNRFNSMTLTNEGKYIKIAPKGEWTINGPDIPCQVVGISETPQQSSASEYIIFLCGSKLHAMDNIQIGDEILISQQLTNGVFGTPLSNILNAFHGYPSIAYEGKLHEGEYNNFENGREYEISSRVMAGTSQDGNTLYIVTTEMSKTSIGVNCIDLANYMLSIGAWNVVNFDSGGSAAIVVDEVMLNYPARDAVRPVMDALLAVSLAPLATDTVAYSFLTPSIRPSAASTTQLSLLSFNQYDEVLAKDVNGFTFTCIPEALGYVDENQKFHAGIQALSGKIIAQKNGKQTELQVYVRPIENFSINPDTILTDQRSYPIVVETTTDNMVFRISPDMLSWDIEDSTVCSVENGILKGEINGETIITGRFGSLTKSLAVKVEIGKGKQIAEMFSNMNDFITKSVGINNLLFKPVENGNGAVMEFDFVGGRAPFLEMAKEITFYGLPDSLSWQYLNQNKIFKDLIFYLEDAQGNAITQRTTLQNEGEQTAIIPFATDGKAWDIPYFPVKLKKVKLNFNSGSLGKYIIPFSGLYAHYPEDNITEIPSIQKNDGINIYTNDHQMYIDFVITDYSAVALQLYAIDGHLFKSLTTNRFSQGKHQYKLDIADIPAGIYILKMRISNEYVSRKIIIY